MRDTRLSIRETVVVPMGDIDHVLKLDECVGVALRFAKGARLLAEATNLRTECLRVAVEALEGALRNVEYEMTKEPKP